jgi:hypothetical protein
MMERPSLPVFYAGKRSRRALLKLREAWSLPGFPREGNYDKMKASFRYFPSVRNEDLRWPKV